MATKIKVTLEFVQWDPPEESTALVLAGDENGESSGSPPLMGNLDLTLEKLHELLHLQQSEQIHGLYRLTLTG